MSGRASCPRRAFALVSMALLLGLAGCSDQVAEQSDSPAGSESTRASADLRTMPDWDPGDEGAGTPIEPGTYLIPGSAWSVGDFTVTFPAGWAVQYGHVYGKHADQPDEFGFYAVVVDEIYSDSCHPGNETTRAVGPRVDDLAAALREQPGGAEVSRAVRTTLGGRPATRVDLRVPEQLDVSKCRIGPYGLQIWHSEPADKYFVLLRDATASVYLVDVDGKRQVFLTQVGSSTSASDRAELRSVLDSIRIE